MFSHACTIHQSSIAHLLTTGMFIDSEIDQPFYIDAPLSLVTRDVDAIEVMVNYCYYIRFVKMDAGRTRGVWAL